MNNADNKYDPVAGQNIEYPIESVLPVGNRPQLPKARRSVTSAMLAHRVRRTCTLTCQTSPAPIKKARRYPSRLMTPGCNTGRRRQRKQRRLAIDDRSGTERSTQVILPDYSGGKAELAKHGVAAGNFQFVFNHIKNSGYRPVWIDGTKSTATTTSTPFSARLTVRIGWRSSG
jgi:hypothetical protein